jgi:hypothetical protein
MKRFFLLISLLVIISNILAYTAKIVVHSNVAVSGSVLIGENFQYFGDDDIEVSDFVNGVAEFVFPVDDSISEDDLQAYANGSTSWGDTSHSGWQTGFSGTPPTKHLYLSFDYPKDISVTIGTNSDVENCVVYLKNGITTIDTKTVDLDNSDYDNINGETIITFNDIFVEGGGYAYLSAEVIATDVYDDSETSYTSTFFTWNSTDEVWENSLDLNFSLPTGDTRSYSSSHNWISYPRLYRSADNTFDAEIILDDIEPYASRIDSPDSYMTYSQGVWNHNNLYGLRSSKGYKLTMSSQNSSYTHKTYGTKLPDQYQISLSGGLVQNWVGYWIEDTQIVSQALGDYWTDLNVRFVKMQYWSAYRNEFDRWVCDGRIPTISYGDMIEIKCTNSILGFKWDNSTPRDNEIIVPKAEYFTYTEQADYIPLYLTLDSDDLPQEIAAKVDGECIGAAVVVDSLVQLRIYPDNRSVGEIEFELYYGERCSNKTVSNYKYNGLECSRIINEKISTTRLMSAYQVDLRNEGYTAPQMKSNLSTCNYPNPFNPTTEINFSIPQSSNVEIKIYNIKGQEIITLIDNDLEEGNHSVIWNGNDSSNNSVATGIYFYKVSTETNSITKRMMLLK